MMNLDEHIAQQSVNEAWQAAFEHNLAHYEAGDDTNFDCPGGEQCPYKTEQPGNADTTK